MQRTYRSPVWVSAIIAVGLVLSVYSAVTLLRSQSTWLSWFVIGLVPLMLAGLIDSLLTRVTLEADTLEVISNFRRRRYARDDFLKVQSGKGVPISLQRRSGGWLHLPSVSPGGQGLVNTLRAWLKRPAI